MELARGTRLGAFEILDLAGKGGMGEVYRARDTKLNRDVAIKVLPEAFARDVERLARFEREAQLLAALNHPNIAAIYGLQQQDGIHCLVMEYVPGDALRGPLKVEDALRIARQVADGLEEAHGKTIVHRDLKPDNIRITPEGKVKILDFGLAKALGPPVPSDSDSTLTVAPGETREGTIMGTPPYMSPEQARGERTDHRTDIWAFGCVLYEVLTGKRTFDGKTSIDALTAVVSAEPKWAALPASTPVAVRQVLELCLEKDVARRLQSIADARVLLDRPAAPGPVPVPQRRSMTGWLAAAVALLALVGGGLLWQVWRTPSQQEWSGVRLGGSEVALTPRISPDGQLLAFLAMVDGQNQVAVMKPGSGNWQVLTHDRSRGLVLGIAWSLDGTKLYFDRARDVPKGVFSVPVLGGEERLVLEDAFLPQVLPDGSLVVARLDSERRMQLHRFFPESGRVVPLHALMDQGPIDARFRAAPSGEVVFFGKPLDQPDSPSHVYALEPDSQKIVRLAPGVSFVARATFPLAIGADGRSAVADLASGDLHRIVSMPIDGSGNLRTLLTLTTTMGSLDVGRDGAIYADQWERPSEVFRFSPLTGVLERIGTATGTAQGDAVPLADGRVVFTSRTANQERLLVAGPGKDPAPFIQTEEETGGPLAMVARTHLAFVIGRVPDRTIALASITDGRIMLRLTRTRGASIDGMVASPDGKTIYYAASGSIWAIPAGDGKPLRISAGDAVTVDPYRQDLILRLSGREGSRLVRIPLAGGAERPIPLEGDALIAPWYLHSTAVAKDGRILLPVALSSHWFWPLGVLDPQSGRTEILRIGYDADLYAGWTADGKIVGVASPLRSSLWRFRAE